MDPGTPKSAPRDPKAALVTPKMDPGTPKSPW